VKLSHLAGLASLACIGAALACGSSSNKGGGGEPDGGGGGEGGTLEGGGAETGPAKLPYVGSVSADSTVAATTTTHSLTGAFALASDAGAAGADGGTCLGTESGSCCYVPPGTLAEAGAGDAGTTVSLVSAGTLSVTDGTTAVANITPGSNNGYAITSGTSNPSVTWNGGDMLTVSAAGAAVEAFSGKMTAVEDFAGLTPALSYKTATTVPIASDLTISWTAGNGTTVHVLIDAVKGTTNEGTISCSAADSAHTVTVPSALLGKFASGDTGLITLNRSSVTQVTGPNATVSLISTSTTGGTAKFQ
jgi:hypothetical protein